MTKIFAKTALAGAAGIMALSAAAAGKSHSRTRREFDQEDGCAARTVWFRQPPAAQSGRDCGRGLA